MTFIALLLAAWVGSLIGSGAYDSEVRFNEARLAAQSAVRVSYGPPAIEGHPGALARVEAQDMLRRFMALDGTN